MDDLNKRLEETAMNGSLDDFMMVLKSVSDINASNKGQAQVDNTSLLHQEKLNIQLLNAVLKNENNRVVELLNQGAYSDSRYNDDKTALMLASKNGNLEIVKSLIDNGADVNAKDDDGDTALIYASANGNSDVVNTLLENKANVHSKNNNGEIALMLASHFGQNDVVNTLIKNKATVNEKDYDGDTALMMASVYGHNEVVKTLIDNGAYINERNFDGDTALVKASVNGENNVVKNLLLNHQAEVSLEDRLKLNQLGANFTLDLIDKRDFEKSLQREIKPIQEQTKKKSFSMKI